jgi:hypothetical protein
VPKDDVDTLARMFKALGNPNRLRLFMNLLEESKLDLAKGRIHDCFLVKLLGGLGDIGAPTVPSATASSSSARSTPRVSRSCVRHSKPASAEPAQRPLSACVPRGANAVLCPLHTSKV